MTGSIARLLRGFREDVEGAITIDWVVLVSAIIGLGLAVGTMVGAASASKAKEIGTSVASQDIMEFN